MAAMLFKRPKSASDSSADTKDWLEEPMASRRVEASHVSFEFLCCCISSFLFLDFFNLCISALFFKSWTCGFKRIRISVFLHTALSIHCLCYAVLHFRISTFPHTYLNLCISVLLHVSMPIFVCFCVSASSHPCCCSQNFADVRKCSQIWVDSCSSFMDFRRCS